MTKPSPASQQILAFSIQCSKHQPKTGNLQSPRKWLISNKLPQQLNGNHLCWSSFANSMTCYLKLYWIEAASTIVFNTTSVLEQWHHCLRRIITTAVQLVQCVVVNGVNNFVPYERTAWQHGSVGWRVFCAKVPWRTWLRKFGIRLIRLLQFLIGHNLQSTNIMAKHYYVNWLHQS